MVLSVPPILAQLGSIDRNAGSVITGANLTFTTIDVPGAGVTAAYGINSAGDVVGIYATDINAAHKHGFLLRSGSFSYIDYPAAYATFAYGINDSGLVVGSAQFDGGTTARGFTYDGVTFTPIRVKGKTVTITYGIDNGADVVGGDGNIYSTTGFALLGGRLKNLNVPGQYVYVFASGINNIGNIVGWADSNGFLCRGGSCRLIEISGANQTSAQGINDSNVIVGWYASSSCVCAFAQRNGRYISFSYPGAAGTFADGINVAGQVVGQYTFDYQTYHGFVTSPIF